MLHPASLSRRAKWNALSRDLDPYSSSSSPPSHDVPDSTVGLACLGPLSTRHSTRRRNRVHTGSGEAHASWLWPLLYAVPPTVHLLLVVVQAYTVPSDLHHEVLATPVVSKHFFSWFTSRSIGVVKVLAQEMLSCSMHAGGLDFKTWGDSRW